MPNPFLNFKNYQNIPAGPQDDVTRPVFFRPGHESEAAALSDLLREKPYLQVNDRIHDQLTGLMESRSPADDFTGEALEEAVTHHLNGCPEWAYGVWVYYPWSEKLIHVLDEAEFVEMRTNRNLYKITREERARLAGCRIGVIGLSVGQSVAISLAMERSFGEIRIADFDTLELSNMNRIRTGLHNLGLRKTVILAREIAEIDPFLQIKCFDEGVTKDNLDRFLHEGGTLDLLVDECDSLGVKILCRKRARENGIPVVMDTSDRGMIDIERFDREPQRPILHGFVQSVEDKDLSHLTSEEKVDIVLKIVGVDTVSMRGKASMLEVEQSISTWPQLATSVILGGAVTAAVIRRILLKDEVPSGRFFVDVDEIIPGSGDPAPDYGFEKMVPAAFSCQKMTEIAGPLAAGAQQRGALSLSEAQLRSLVDAARHAPSSGNDQPWKWLYRNDRLFLFHEYSRSFSFGDYHNIASYISLGTAIENLFLQALTMNIQPEIALFPLGPSNDNRLIAKIDFFPLDSANPPFNPAVAKDLVKYIAARHTNRNNAGRVPIHGPALQAITEIVHTMKGAEIHWIREEQKISRMGAIISDCDRIRLLHPHGHHDFIKREMRWSPEEAEEKKDGIDVATLGISAAQMSALQLIKDPRVIHFLNEIHGGSLFETVSEKSIECASVLGLITMPRYSPEDFVRGGRVIERVWLYATKLGLALHPLIAPLYFFPRVLYGGGEGLSAQDADKIGELRRRFLEIVPLGEGMAEVFLFKLAVAPEPEVKALRLPLDEILCIDND